jgi:hypothetical protein
MMLIDTSVLVGMFRDQTGSVAERLDALINGEDIYLTRFTQMELLQGARNDAEWLRLESYLDGQDYVEASDFTWTEAARIYFDMRRKGQTVRSVVDCCIAQLAVDHHMALVHDDRDFEMIANFRRLRHFRLHVSPVMGFHEREQDPLL